MNKEWKYKPGDKVIILDDNFGYKKNDIGKIIKYDDVGGDNDGYLINVPNRISTSIAYKPDVWFDIKFFKYYYEEPLQDLFKRITANCPPIMKDYSIIRPLIDSDKTLTKEELITCQNLWEKYNI